MSRKVTLRIIAGTVFFVGKDARGERPLQPVTSMHDRRLICLYDLSGEKWATLDIACQLEEEKMIEDREEQAEPSTDLVSRDLETEPRSGKRPHKGGHNKRHQAYPRGKDRTLEFRRFQLKLAMMPREEFERREAKIIEHLRAWQRKRRESHPEESQETPADTDSGSMDHQEPQGEEHEVVPFPTVRVNFRG